jgi:acetylglutamate kinase
MDILQEKAKILIEALPYIQTLSGKTVVIKYGGSAMLDDAVVETILQDITLLKYVGVNPIVIHGGGPDINAMMDRLNIKSEFHEGLRITDESAMEVVQMVLTHKTNANIVARLNGMGARPSGCRARTPISSRW